MKVNITKSEDEGLAQDEYGGVSSLTVHDDGSLIVRTSRSGFMYESDEWTAFAVDKTA